MQRRSVLILFLNLFLAWPAFSDGQTVQQQLGAKTDEKGDVHFRYGMRPLDEILSAKTIRKEVIEKQDYQDSGRQQTPTHPDSSPAEGKKAADEPVIPLANHNCRPELVPFSDPTAPKPACLKEGLSSEDVFRLLGAPAQKTFCLACPLWKYREGFVVFTPERTLSFWQGKGFEKYLPPVEKKMGSVKTAMTKNEVQAILGSPDGGIYFHNDWRYGKSHVIFSKNTGLVTHLLRFDGSLP